MASLPEGSKRKYHHIKIKSDSVLGRDCFVWLDGKELTGVREVHFRATCNELTEVGIVMLAEFEADTPAEIKGAIVGMSSEPEESESDA